MLFFREAHCTLLGCDFFERVGEKRIHKMVFGLCVSDCVSLSTQKYVKCDFFGHMHI